MKIEIFSLNGQDPIVIDTNSADVVCTEVYCGLGIKTDIGFFGIAERDGIIEIVYDGDLLICSDRMKMEIDMVRALKQSSVSEKIEKPIK